MVIKKNKSHNFPDLAETLQDSFPRLFAFGKLASQSVINFWCFNATFNYISAISWRSVSVVEKAGVPREKHQPWASNW
jgi:hypothetical protein